MYLANENVLINSLFSARFGVLNTILSDTLPRVTIFLKVGIPLWAVGHIIQSLAWRSFFLVGIIFIEIHPFIPNVNSIQSNIAHQKTNLQWLSPTVNLCEMKKYPIPYSIVLPCLYLFFYCFSQTKTSYKTKNQY